MNTASALVVLYCVATAVAIAVRRLRTPYTVTLVIVGLGLGWLRLISPPHLTRDLLFTFFLPGLLFEAAFHLDLAASHRIWRSAVSLAVPGVVLAMGITAFMLVAAGRMLGLPNINVNTGLVFGALVAATDPVAVTALFREVKVPARLTALVESESLANDGTGVVLLSLIVGFATGARSTASAAVLQFVLVAGGGVVIGVCSGWLISKVIGRVDEPVIEIGLTVIAAYGSFVLADGLGASGVLATVTAGIMAGREGRDRGMTMRSRQAVESFWEYVAFALNSIVFLLIGFQFDARRLGSMWLVVLAGFAAMMLARAIIVLAVIAPKRLLREWLPIRWVPVVTWGGLRGALSMVLALALPDALTNRELLVSLTVGVVLLSIVLQGLSMPLLVRSLQGREQITEDANGVLPHRGVGEEPVSPSAVDPVADRPRQPPSTPRTPTT